MLSELKSKLLAESCEEYLCQLFERIEKSSLNAFTTLAKESALKEARLFDKNPGRGLLAGVPIAIKECISTKGIETNCSSRILRGYIPPYDAHVIERLKAEGAIIMGKTNMDEFAMGTSRRRAALGRQKIPGIRLAFRAAPAAAARQWWQAA
jgi:aspartyl-tRNA(Asn)/glutamyl-tRNA(Gln) amidotransferase subunit A